MHLHPYLASWDFVDYPHLFFLCANASDQRLVWILNLLPMVDSMPRWQVNIRMIELNVTLLRWCSCILGCDIWRS